MKTPKLSIIIATFNAEKTLSVALDSVINQIFQDWECIIVDGASRDNTVEIVRSYVERDSRIRYISEPDKGIYDAFNKGWKLAKGEWIHYLGSDDNLVKDGIELLLREESDYDVLYGNTIFTRGNTKKNKESVSVKELKGRMVCHQSILMRKSVIEELNGFNLKYKIAADFDLLQNALFNNYKFHHVKCFVSDFNCQGISNEGVEILKEAFKIRLKYHTNNIFILYYKYIKFYLKRKIRSFYNCFKI